MAVKQSIVIASVLLLVVFIEQGSAIKCYQCNSHYDIGCDLNVPTSNYSVDCSTKQERDDKNRPIEYTFCRKIYQVIEFAVNQLPPNTRIIRSCGYDSRSYAGQCYKRHGFGGRQVVCACQNSDHCNHSNTLQSPMMLIALFSVSVIGFLSQRIHFIEC